MEKFIKYLADNPTEYLTEITELIRKLVRDYTPQQFLAAFEMALEHNEKLLMNEKDINRDLERNERIYLANLQQQINPIKVIASEPVQIEIAINGPIKVNVSKYLQDVLACKDISEFDLILPPKTTKNYAVILKTLLIKLKSEINIIRKLLVETNDFSVEELIDVKEQYQILTDCFEYLVTSNKEEITEVEVEEECPDANKLWFLTTDITSKKGSCVLSDLKNRIPDDDSYYQTFSNMLQKLKKGYNRSDQDIRPFGNDDTLRQLMEVKNGNGSRLFFYHLENNNIMIICCYLKRQQKEKKLKDLLQLRYAMFINQKADIISKLSDPDYICGQEIIESEIANLLPPAEKNDRVKSNG